MKPTKVARAALMARLNRKLAHENQHLYANQSKRPYTRDLGAFYILDVDLNSIEAAHVDPVALARELGVLRPFEIAEGFE